MGNEAIQINVSGDRGEAFVVFNRAMGVQPPAVSILPPQEAGTILPANAFAHEWDKQGRAWQEAESVTRRIWIKTKEKLPPFANASGSIVLRWPDGEHPYLPFRVADSTTRTFTATPATAAVFTHFREENAVRVYVENTGIPKINTLRFTFTPLVDAENKNEILANELEAPASLERFQGRSFAIPVPKVSHAGVYQGVLKISADGSPTQSVALTVRSRGPWPFVGAPLLFFAVTLLIGYSVSRLLAEWIDLGGAQRNSALLNLHGSRQDLDRIAGQLGDAAVRLLPRTKLTIDFMLQDIAEALARGERKPQAELDAARQKAGTLAEGLRHLVKAVTHIETHRPETRTRRFRSWMP